VLQAAQIEVAEVPRSDDLGRIADAFDAAAGATADALRTGRPLQAVPSGANAP
jgi:hypothetical protein